MATNKSIYNIVGGTADDRTILRHALLLRLDGGSAALREIASTCLSRALARDMILDWDFIQLFRLLGNEDRRIRAPIIAELQTLIQTSDEAARRRMEIGRAHV